MLTQGECSRCGATPESLIVIDRKTARRLGCGTHLCYECARKAVRSNWKEQVNMDAFEGGLDSYVMTLPSYEVNHER